MVGASARCPSRIKAVYEQVSQEVLLAKKTEQASPDRRLREVRKQHYWTQSLMAEKLGITVVNVNRWESGKTILILYLRQKLRELFSKGAEELGLVPEVEKQERMGVSPALAHPLLWNVPFRRNPYFTESLDVLTELEAVLQTDNAATLVHMQAISGLGGIGKTQTAIEYAYSHRDSYQAVLWAKADSRKGAGRRLCEPGERAAVARAG